MFFLSSPRLVSIFTCSPPPPPAAFACGWLDDLCVCVYLYLYVLPFPPPHFPLAHGPALLWRGAVFLFLIQPNSISTSIPNLDKRNLPRENLPSGMSRFLSSIHFNIKPLDPPEGRYAGRPSSVPSTCPLPISSSSSSPPKLSSS